MRIALTSSLLIFTLNLSAQIGMQQWRIHFSVFNTVGIAGTATDVYMACSNGIVEYDIEDNYVDFLTVTNGLSDLGISSIDSDGSTVVVGYSNGNLDIIEGNTITNVPWIKLAELSGDKTVNSVSFYGDFAYVSTNIGLVVLNIADKEIKDTYYPYANPVVYDAAVYQDTLYAATEDGLYYAHKDAGFLNDLSQWQKYTNLPGAVINGPFTEVETFGDRMFFAYNSVNFQEDTIYYFDGSGLNYYANNPVNVNNIHAEADEVLISQFSTVYVLDTGLNVKTTIYDYFPGVPSPAAAIKMDGKYWIADQNHGLVRNYTKLYNNSPYTDGSYRLDVQYGKVLVAGGGLTNNFQNNYFRNGVYLFENEEWTNFNHLNQDSIAFDKDWDFISVAINPSNTDEMAFSSFSEGGLKIIRDGLNIIEVYYESNSALETKNGKHVIPDLRFDDQNNLWVVNQGLEPLKVFSPVDGWHSYSLGSAAKDKYPYRLMIDNNGNKWVAVTNVGLIAYNDNGTIADHSDDQIQTLTNSEGYGNLPSIQVKSIAEDLDGEIWIGTEEGLVVLYSTNNLYDGGYGDYDASSILLEVDGEVERLLGDTYISSIAVDGGNRKWIGTSSAGVFCLSPDGLEVIYQFTEENSPLISNNVLDIRIDHFSGEVFFATDRGLVSFRSDATIFDEDFSNVTVFPNPVEPGFTGPVTIQGLGYDSDVKITDVAGNLVYKTVSNGGTAIWDGKTLQGERVQTGVYLVWTGTAGSSKGKNVAKILFIN